MKGNGRAPTITQVAAVAGVNRSSVSRAFSHPELLSADTVASIKAAAASLGYSPNYSARALSTGRHGNIALIVPDIANPFFAHLIRAAQNMATHADFCIFLGNTDEDAGQEDQLLTRLAGQVDGFVLAFPQLPDERIREYAKLKPLVLINRDLPGIPRILIDSSSGAIEAVEHLAELGHKRVAYVGGSGASWSNKQRRSAIKKVADRLDLDLLSVATQLPSHEAGRQAVPAIMDHGATGVIAFDDVTAQGVLAGLGTRGVTVPEDIALIGGDDLLGASAYPPLTSISNCSADAGKAAVNLLLDMLKTKAIGDARYVLATRLLVRGTSENSGASALA